jgi:hypothetical protein
MDGSTMDEIEREILERFNYDPETGVMTRTCRRRADSTGCVVRTRNGKKYIAFGVLNKNMYAHVIAWFLQTGSWAEEVVDHIDGDGTNNKWNNLRSVSRKINQRNKCRHRNNTSGHTGIYWEKRISKWFVKLAVDGKQVYLGYFKDKNEAIQCRLAAEKQHGYTERHL